MSLNVLIGTDISVTRLFEEDVEILNESQSFIMYYDCRIAVMPKDFSNKVALKIY